MKTLRITFAYLGLFAVTSCNNGSDSKKDNPKENGLPEYTIVEIEGCEYFRFKSTHDFVHIAHKGNCKNPIHCHNK